MKKKLSTLIFSLKKEEIRSLKIYMSRIESPNQASAGKKTEALFNAIRYEGIDEYDEKLLVLLSIDNKNSLYQIKNRLIDEIEQSLLLQYRHSDERSKIQNYVNLAKIFLQKTKYKTTFQYLKKAEKLAAKSQNYPQLCIIYEQIIELSNIYRELKPQVYVEKWQMSAESYEKWRNYQCNIATINNRLIHSNFSKKDVLINEILETTIQSLKTELKEPTSPRLELGLFDCTKSVLLQNKEFESLELYLISNYNRFKKDGFYHQNNHSKKITAITWIINTLIKNKKLTKAASYLPEFLTAIEAYNKQFYESHIWLYHQSQVVIYSFNNQQDKAIDLLMDLSKEKDKMNIPLYTIFIYLNLCVINFSKGNLDLSIKYLSQLINEGDFKKYNINWQVNILIVDLILHFEKKDFMYCQYKIKSLKKTYRSYLKTDAYKRAYDFINLLFMLCQKKESFQNVNIQNKVKLFIQNSPPFEPAANEAINYTVWLQAKLENNDYYELILQKMINQS